MRFALSDLKPGDHVVWKKTMTMSRLELIVLSVDRVNRTWTHLCVVNDNRPNQVGDIYTTPQISSKESWECLHDDAEIVSRFE